MHYTARPSGPQRDNVAVIICACGCVLLCSSSVTLSDYHALEASFNLLLCPVHLCCAMQTRVNHKHLTRERELSISSFLVINVNTIKAYTKYESKAQF